MKDLISTAIRFEDRKLRILDQQLIPREEKWLEASDLDTMISIIQALKVRGAPAIGVAASLFLLAQSYEGRTAEELLGMSYLLRSSRPTAVNLMNYLDRLDGILREGEAEGWREQFEGAVVRIFEEDVELCERIASNGNALVPNSARILTHCNTGSLATAGRGTALGIITKASESGKEIYTWVDETRPLLQGGRLTAWELEKAKIPYSIVCDSMAGILMSQQKVDCVIVGADRIAMNGDFANKIGTYSLAVLCSHHKVPFYVAAPETTIDRSCPDGSRIPIEERKPEEVRGYSTPLHAFEWSPKDAPVFNPAFDVTPAELVTGWVFDTGVRTQADW